MDYVISLLQYDLECHGEDYLIAEHNLSEATKMNNEDSIQDYYEEMKTLLDHKKQLKQAIEILTKHSI